MEDPATLAGKLAEVWIRVVQNYSARTLTKTSDKLITLQGVITALENVLNQKSVAGMWQPGLWNQLLWCTDNSSPNDAPPSYGQELPFSALTWSWLSAPGAVFHHHWMQIDPMSITRRLDDLTPIPELSCSIALYAWTLRISQIT